MPENKKYQIIYADPAWSYNVWRNKESRTADSHYRVSGLEEMKLLRVSDIAEDNCVLLMWTTAPWIGGAIELMRSWGFTYKTIAFVWVKKNKIADSLFWGMGHYTRSNAEFVILGIKGHPKRIARNIHQIVETKIQTHSKKPAIIRNKITELFGDLPKIELFATERVENWDCWGDEVQGDVIL
jgi:N6-adenosine-specific RNA methylase IME4